MLAAADWVNEIVAGDRVSLARALTQVENGTDAGEALLDEASRHQGEGIRIGITGSPGAGKSTLIEALVRCYRARQRTVGIVAVDPSSSLTGGALLGDRVRMGRLAGDPGIFVRSMATRGQLGGLAPYAVEALDLLEAAGFERVILETVGVGQADVDVRYAVDIVVVVIVPEGGDGIQGLKAGLVELGDLIVVNKADRPGARELGDAMEEAIHLRTQGNREVPVVLTTATTESGVEALVDLIEEHATRRAASGATQALRRRTLHERLRRLLSARLLSRAGSRVDSLEKQLADAAERVLAGASTPGREIDRLVAQMDI